MKNKLKLIDKYKLADREYIKEYFSKYFFLTVSQLTEILDIFSEMETLKKENPKKLVDDYEINSNNNKKLNGTLFYNYIKSVRYPMKTQYNRILKQKISLIKDKSIKVLYCRNLECGGVKLEMNLENIQEFNRILNKINNNKKEIEDIICIINSGDICLKE